MKKEELDEIISGIDPEILDSAEKRKRPGAVRVLRVAAAAAVLAVLLFVFIMPALRGAEPLPPDQTSAAADDPDSAAATEKSGTEVIPAPMYGNFMKYEAAYPEQIKVFEKNADYSAQLLERVSHYGRGHDLSGFFNAINAAAKSQAEKNGEKNVVLSPLNVYMALALVGEISEGETQAQIFGALGVDSLDGLREKTKNIWLASYCDNGSYKSVLANSIWLDDDGGYKFSPEKISALQNGYYASAFYGDLQSDGFAAAYRAWLNDQTDGRLKDVVSGIKPSENTAMILASTVDFAAKWSDFYTTENGVFKCADGTVNRTFLKRISENGTVWLGENCSAYKAELENSAGAMWYILPDEGVSVDEIFSSLDVKDIATSLGLTAVRDIYLTVKVPALDISQQTDVKETLKAIGVMKCFEASDDFSSFASGAAYPLGIGGGLHTARVITNKKGVVGVAFTEVQGIPTASDPSALKKYEFIADRPFIFVIKNDDGLPLFFGIVNEP